MFLSWKFELFVHISPSCQDCPSSPSCTGPGGTLATRVCIFGLLPLQYLPPTPSMACDGTVVTVVRLMSHVFQAILRLPSYPAILGEFLSFWSYPHLFLFGRWNMMEYQWFRVAVSSAAVCGGGWSETVRFQVLERLDRKKTWHIRQSRCNGMFICHLGIIFLTWPAASGKPKSSMVTRVNNQENLPFVEDVCLSRCPAPRYPELHERFAEEVGQCWHHVAVLIKKRFQVEVPRKVLLWMEEILNQFIGGLSMIIPILSHYFMVSTVSTCFSYPRCRSSSTGWGHLDLEPEALSRAWEWNRRGDRPRWDRAGHCYLTYVYWFVGES